MASTAGASPTSNDPAAKTPVASNPEQQTSSDQTAKSVPAPKAKTPVDPNVKYEIVTPKAADGVVTNSKDAPAAKSEVKSGDTSNTSKEKTSAGIASTTTTTPKVASHKQDAKATPSNPTVAKANDTKAAIEDDSVVSGEPVSSTDKAAAVAEQNLYFKHRRRDAFKRAILGGAARVLATDLVDAADLVAEDMHGVSDLDTDMGESDIDDNNDKGDHEQHDSKDTSTLHDDSPGDNQHHADAHEASHTGEHPPLQVNGAAVGNAAAAADSGPPPKRPEPQVTIRNKDDGKDTFQFTQKDLNALDEAAAAHSKEMSLRYRWSAFSFYFMASLSMILPLLFVVLGAFIVAMDNKPLTKENGDRTPWSVMPDVIKTAITLWPIVFAAVVAQAFKTWATYRLERGVTLGELEQLVGVNSFAAAAKQPFHLRRLDVLTLFVFLAWCLSPIGSQMFQRVYEVQRGNTTRHDSVQYLSALGQNPMLMPNAARTLGDSLYAEYLQTAAVYYLQGLAAPPTDTSAQANAQASGVLNWKGSQTSDIYGHPIPWQASQTFDNFTYEINTGFYGIPISFPPTPDLPDDPNNLPVSSNTLPGASMSFPVNTSFFNLTCHKWRNTTWKDLQLTNNNPIDKNNYMYFSPSSTVGINFTTLSGNASGILDGINYATLTDKAYLEGNNFNGNRHPQDNASYLYMSCDMEQIYISATVDCSVDVRSIGKGTYSYSYAWACGVNSTSQVFRHGNQQVPAEWQTAIDPLEFADLLTHEANPQTDASPITPSERYIDLGHFVDGAVLPLTETDIVQNVQPEQVASELGQLLNTWITIGYCPECVGVYNLSLILDPYNGTELTQPYNVSAIAKQRISNSNQSVTITYSALLVYDINEIYASITLTSSIILLLIGAGSVLLEARLVAPDTLGYVSSVARNSRYLHLPKKTVGGAMSGPMRARQLRDVEVMMQDVKSGDPEVGKIALGNKTERSVRLKSDRVYR